MSREAGERAPASAAPWLPVVCVVSWLVAAASSGPLGIWLTVGGVAVALGVTVLVLDSAEASKILRPSPRLVLMGLAAGGSMAAGTHLLYPGFAHLLPFISADTVRLYAAFRGPPPVIASLVLLPVILGEELVWRGVVQTALMRRIGPWPAVPVGALSYTLAHAPLGSPVLLVVALSCGMVWGALRAASGSLVPTLVAHLLWDLLVLLWLPLDPR